MTCLDPKPPSSARAQASAFGATLCVLASLLAGMANADTLALRGGDRLTGALMSVAEGTVVFRTALGGLMVVPAGEILWVQTDAYYTVELDDGRRLTGRLVREGGEQRITGIDDEPSLPLDPERIAKADAVVLDTRRRELPTGIGDGDDPLSAQLGAGYLYRWTRDDFGAPYTRLVLERTTSRYHFLSESLLTVADDASWPRLFDSLTELRLRDRWRLEPEFGVRLSRDVDRGTAFRGGVHLGAGRTWEWDDGSRLTLSGGLQVEYALHDAELLPWLGGRSNPLRMLQVDLLIADVLRDGPGALAESGRRLLRLKYYQTEQDERSANLYLRLRHETSFLRRVSLASELRLLPELADGGDVRAQAWSRFRLPVGDDLAVQLDLRLDYESAPSLDRVDRWSPSIGAGLSWEF